VAAKQRQSRERAQHRQLLTTEDLAEVLKVSRHTVYQMRHRSEGPRWIRLDSRSVRYRPEDVGEWLEERAAATAEQAPPAA
jgi:excisionase family DNA binding protein